MNGSDSVEETAFGKWFLGTNVWRHQVVRAAVEDLVQRAQPRVSVPILLDVGCGPGKAFRLLDILFRPAFVIGLDIDCKQLVRGTQEARRCRCRVALSVGSGERLPLRDRSIDTIFCHQTFHHLVDHDGAIREFFRVLRPGGQLLFAESCRRYIRSLPIRLLFRHPMHVQKSAGEYLALLRRAGFDIEPEAVSTPYLWWSRPDLGLFERLGWRVPATREATLLNVVAVRPADT